MSDIKPLIIIMFGLSVLFYLGGLLQDPNCVANGHDLCPNTTPTSYILRLVFNPTHFQNNNFAILIQASIALGGIAAIVVLGIFTRNTALAAAAPIAGILFVLLFDFVNVIRVVYLVSPYVAILIFPPILFVGALNIFDWWRGRV
jgi:hypothetical protein